MDKYNTNLAFRITFVVVLAALTGILLWTLHYWFAFGTSLLLTWSIVGLVRFQKRIIKDTSRLINAIRFSESNISFRNFELKGLPMEISLLMEKSIAQFNKKTLQTETEQQFYNSLLNRIDAGILVINQTGGIEWINKAALDEFGKPHPQRISDLHQVSSELPHILENIHPKETKIVRIQKGNTIRQLAVTACLFTAQGKELKLISIKNIESVLEESESDAWKKLIRVLTHEMMNSITPIISLSESFSGQDAKQSDSQLIFRAMETIHRRSKGLVKFVQNYQKLAKIPPPVMDIIPAKTIMDDITKLMAADGIHFDCTITPEDIQWKVDCTQIEQVLINLIKNAWEACCEREHPKIKVLINKNEYQQPVISITDNGEGILPEVLDKIFVPFFTTKPNGSGIGLSICRQIIGAHGGVISVTSEVGKGSCFVVRL